MTDKPKPQIQKIKAVPDPSVSQRGSAHTTGLDLPPAHISIEVPKETTESTGEPKKD